MRKTTSLAPPIIYGVLLILVVIVLTALWNVALLTDWFRAQSALPSHVNTGILLSGYLLFICVIVGLILFIVSLARQIRLNQRQQNFIDSVTHELKSPLTSLKLHLETMRLRDLPPEMRAQFTERMLGDVERLNLLIDHVLEAARVDQSKRDWNMGDLAVGPQLETAIAVVTQRHNLPAGAIACDVSEGLTVRADPVALELVLLNLLENAVKYSRDSVEIRVRARPEGEGQVAIAVADTGVGIPRNQLKRVFKRFHRVGNEMTRIRQGTGLGLYIAQETMRRLNGRISAQSPGENLGSTFTLLLPAGGAPHG